MVAPRRKRQSAKERKPAILQALYEVIEEEGFENASLAKVAKKAGVHASLVIHYFGTKEKMVLELVDDVLHTYAMLIRRLPKDGAADERLERLLGLIWSREWHNAASFTVVFSFLALSCRDASVMDRVQNLYRVYRDYLTRQIRFFKKSGIITTTDPEAAVEALISLSEGSHYFCRYHVKQGEFDEHCRRMIQAARTVLGVKTDNDRSI